MFCDNIQNNKSLFKCSLLYFLKDDKRPATRFFIINPLLHNYFKFRILSVQFMLYIYKITFTLGIKLTKKAVFKGPLCFVIQMPVNLYTYIDTCLHVICFVGPLVQSTLYLHIISMTSVLPTCYCSAFYSLYI